MQFSHRQGKVLLVGEDQNHLSIPVLKSFSSSFFDSRRVIVKWQKKCALPGGYLLVGMPRNSVDMIKTTPTFVSLFYCFLSKVNNY